MDAATTGAEVTFFPRRFNPNRLRFGTRGTELEGADNADNDMLSPFSLSSDNSLIVDINTFGWDVCAGRLWTFAGRDRMAVSENRTRNVSRNTDE